MCPLKKILQGIWGEEAEILQLQCRPKLVYGKDLGTESWFAHLLLDK